MDKFLHEVADYLGDDVKVQRGRARDNMTANPHQRADRLDSLWEAMQYVPNTGILHWNEWNKIGMALYAATDGDELGLAMFYDWTQRNVHTQHRDCTKRWRDYSRCPPTIIGAGSLFKMAHDAGYQNSVEDTVKWRTVQQQRRRAAHFKPTI